jgi:hypothetical protein
VMRPIHAVITMARRMAGTLLWSTCDEIQCRMVPYDGTRYQLRLMRKDGTIRSTLCRDYAQALRTSHEWRRQWDANSAT